MAKLNGKTALITGSTDGVGRMVAERLGADGWRILVHGRDRGRGEQVVAAIKKSGGAAEFLQADLSSLAEVRRLADAVQKATKRLDLLINNAGIGSGGPQGMRETSADGYELRFAVNYLSGFLLTHLLMPLLEEQRAGAHRQCGVARPAGDRFRRCDVDGMTITACAPTGRASSRKSCSPSRSRRS